MFKKYGHFRQREFKGNWVKKLTLGNATVIIDFPVEVYCPESLRNKKVDFNIKKEYIRELVKNNPDLIADYVRKHFFRSIYYFIESMADIKNEKNNIS